MDKIISCIGLGGSTIISGEGKMLIIVVGEKSSLRKKELNNKYIPKFTNLQRELTRIAEKIGNFGLLFGFLIITILLIR